MWMQIRYFWLLEIKSAESKLQKANCVDLTTWVPQKEYCSYNISIWNKVMNLIKLILRQAALDNLKMNCMFSLALFFFSLSLPEFLNCGLFNLLRLLTANFVTPNYRCFTRYLSFLEAIQLPTNTLLLRRSNTTGSGWNKQSLGSPQLIKYDLADSVIGLLTCSGSGK